MSNPAISIATPTYGRDQRLQRQLGVVLAQSEQNFEWLILDDSPHPSEFFRRLEDPRIRYHHHAGPRMTIGAKRNWLAGQARGPVIAHFDDDDYYAPDYLRFMLRRLSQSRADIVKFSGWFVYNIVHRKLGYWNTAMTQGLHYCLSAQQPIIPMMFSAEQSKAFETHFAGFGYTYVYRKAMWEAGPFPAEDFNEDYGFVKAAIERGCRLEHGPDTENLCLQIMRPEGVSAAFPQYMLPDFMLARLFGAGIEAVLKV